MGGRKAPARVPARGRTARPGHPQAELGRLNRSRPTRHHDGPRPREALVHLVVQACILGILIGGVYALMASGLTLVFGIMRVINVAQGAMVILGAYVSYSIFT